MAGCVSGRNGLSDKQLCRKRYRGFESPSNSRSPLRSVGRRAGFVVLAARHSVAVANTLIFGRRTCRVFCDIGNGDRWDKAAVPMPQVKRQISLEADVQHLSARRAATIAENKTDVVTPDFSKLGGRHLVQVARG